VRVEERADPVPGDRQILVRVRYSGLNPADTLQRAGRYRAPPGNPPDIPGLEVAGAVESCGPGVTAWQPGDRVFGLVGGGGLADRVLVHESNVTAAPDALDEQAAAAVPEAFITAHDAVVTQGALAAGETLLVHGAAGGVGTAAIRIGLDRGARVLAVVRSDRAADGVAALGAEAVRDEGFAESVRQLTGDRGADVILELVGAPHFPGNFEALAPRGRICVLSVAAGQDVEVPLLVLMSKRALIRGSVLRPRSIEEKAAAVSAFARDVVPGLASGRMRPLVDSVFLAAEVTAAFDRLDGPGKLGKVLIEW
jgi:putative PIG3 family NAD(P)H quinone oxidoreductase